MGSDLATVTFCRADEAEPAPQKGETHDDNEAKGN